MEICSNKKIVNFVIGGTQKGGTTALDAYLRKHPEICMANTKEVHFFDNDDFFLNDAPDYSKYHDWFSPQENHIILGESTPIYMYWKESPKRIWEYNPNMKIIILLRNPIERTYSHWNMERLRDADKFSFWEAITLEEERCREAMPKQHRVYSYIDRGFYLEQLKNLWDYFPKENVLIIKNEHLRFCLNETLNCVCDFLGISMFENIERKDVHCMPYASGISIREKEYLRAIFESEIKKLETELNWDCSDWLVC